MLERVDNFVARIVVHLFGGMILKSNRLQALFYRWRCPGSNLSVRSCIRRGECGCDNGPPRRSLSSPKQGGE